jgi:hypothetical protein
VTSQRKGRTISILTSRRGQWTERRRRKAPFTIPFPRLAVPRADSTPAPGPGAGAFAGRTRGPERSHDVDVLA